jgi:hypothetical protein
MGPAMPPLASSPPGARGPRRSQSDIISPEFDVPLTPVTHRPRKTHPGCSTIKYNRRNNPDLDKRRIHFCDFMGKCTIYLG